MDEHKKNFLAPVRMSDVGKKKPVIFCAGYGIVRTQLWPFVVVALPYLEVTICYCHLLRLVLRCLGLWVDQWQKV